MNARRTLLAWVCWTAGLLAAGGQVPGGELFTNSAVRKLQIEIGESEMASLRASGRKAVPALVREGNRRWERVGVHVKGAVGSRRSLDEKPSLTLAFDKFAAAQRFHGLTRIHLNNSAEDPAFLSEWLGGELFRAAGVPAARVTHAMVELNGRRLGMYVLVEGLEEEFLGAHFRRTDGHLYEPGPGHDVNEEMDEKTGRRPKHQGDLRALALALAETNAATRWQQVQARLDVERFVSFMALEVLLGHRDGYCLARNNFRIYHDMDAGSDRLVFLPHGMDQLFGRAPTTLQPHLEGLVARAVMGTDEGRARFQARVGVLFTNLFDLPAVRHRVEERAAVLRKQVSWLGRRGFDRETAAFQARVAARHAQMAAQLQQAWRVLPEQGGQTGSDWKWRSAHPVLNRHLALALNRNHAVRWGARGVPPAVFGVPPKSSPRGRDAPFGAWWVRRRPVGETPTGATGTVAFPISTAWFRLNPGGGRPTAQPAWEGIKRTIKITIKNEMCPPLLIAPGSGDKPIDNPCGHNFS